MYKFRIIATICLNLHVSWACILLTNIKEKTKDVIRKFNDKGEVTEVNVKNNLNLCTMIPLIILGNLLRSEWT